MKHRYDLATLFADCFLFQHFERSDYDFIKELLQWQQKSQGEYFFHVGDKYSGFFLVCDGEVEIVKQNQPDSSDQILTVVTTGGLFGEIALFLPDGRRSASARAKTNTDCCFLPSGIFDDLLQQNHAVANKIVLAMAKTLSERLDQITKKSLHLSSSQSSVNNNKDIRDILKFKQQLANTWSF